MRARLILVTAVLLSAPLPLDAQEDVAFRAGIDLLAVVGDLGESITAPTVGVDVGLPLGSGLALRPGVSYAARGRIDYLQLSSLLARPRVVGSGRLSLGVKAGPWLAIKVACDASGSFGPRLCEGPRPGAQGTDLGLSGGLGLSYGNPDRALVSIDALYHAGLTDVVNYPPPTIGVEIADKEYTRALSLQVGVVLKP